MSDRDGEREEALPRGQRVAAAVTIAMVVAAALLPLALVMKQALTPDRESFAWPPTWLPHELTTANFRALASSAEVPGAIALSAGLAVAVAVATLLIAAPAAWLAGRDRGASRALDGTIVLARVFPQIAIAVPLAVVFVRLGLYNRPSGAGLWLAHVLLGLPLAFLILRAGFRDVPPDVEAAAYLDGAGPVTVFLRVTLPLVRPQLATAGLLAWLLSWDDFGYALLLQVTNRTLPPLVYYLSAFGFPGLASAVAVVMLIPALVLVFVLEPAFRGGVLAGSDR